MKEQTDLLDLSRYAYGRLRERLAGLTEEEYRWEPGPGVSTLAWRIAHIAELLSEERNAAWLGVDLGTAQVRPPMTSRDVLGALDAANNLWLDVVAAVPEGTLSEPLGSVAGPYGNDSRRSFVLHVLDELIHHGAEVGLVRDLWAARSPQG